MIPENNSLAETTSRTSALQYHLTKLKTDGAIIGGALVAVATTLSLLVVLQENWSGLWVVPATLIGLLVFLVPGAVAIREVFRRQQKSDAKIATASIAAARQSPLTVFAMSLAFGMLLTGGVLKNSLQSGVYYQLGQRHLAAREYTAAAEDFTRYIELAPTHAVGYYKRGLAMYKAGRLEQAYGDLKTAVRQQPRDWKSRLLLLGTLERLGRPDELNTELEFAEKLNPGARRSLSELLESVDG